MTHILQVYSCGGGVQPAQSFFLSRTQHICAFMVHKSTQTSLLTGGYSIHWVEFEGKIFLGQASVYTG